MQNEACIQFLKYLTLFTENSLKYLKTESLLLNTNIFTMWTRLQIDFVTDRKSPEKSQNGQISAY